jgi:prevent-host-death family protein
MDRIGVRELRQHASRYLERVARGESLEVTDRGRPVARFVPPNADPHANSIVHRIVAPAEDDADITEEAPGDYNVDASVALAEMRATER